jgi:hypothetical protein
MTHLALQQPLVQVGGRRRRKKVGVGVDGPKPGRKKSNVGNDGSTNSIKADEVAVPKQTDHNDDCQNAGSAANIDRVNRKRNRK